MEAASFQGAPVLAFIVALARTRVLADRNLERPSAAVGAVGGVVTKRGVTGVEPSVAANAVIGPIARVGARVELGRPSGRR